MSRIFIGNNKWYDDDGLILTKKGKIDWVANTKKKINFRCFDYYGYYIINEVIFAENGKVTSHLYRISFDHDLDKEYIVNYQTLRLANFSYILGFYSTDFLYNIGDIVNEKFLVLKREHKKIYPKDNAAGKVYTCRCLLDGYVFEIPEKALKKKKMCAVCHGNIVVAGVNDLITSRPEIIKFLKNKEDAYRYTGKSNKAISFVCDICGCEFSCAISDFNRNFPCGCYSSESYPNRLIQLLFQQLKIDYIREVGKNKFSWCENYRYDLYFEYNSQKYIVEMDGGRHKGDKLYIDKLKDYLALSNGIEVIRINCDYKSVSNRLEYIKNNILGSKLSDIFNLKNIDWKLIDKTIAEKSITRDVCNLRNKGYSNKEIAQELGISLSMVDSRIRIGKNNNLIDDWAVDSRYNKTKVLKITNMLTGNIQYCVGVRNFNNTSEKYVGKKIKCSDFSDYSKDGHFLINEYIVEKISFYDYMLNTKTA